MTEKRITAAHGSRLEGGELAEPDHLVARSGAVGCSTGQMSCCGAGAFWGWSPPALPADTSIKRRVDRVVPRSGWSLVLYFAAVIGLLKLAPVLPRSGQLAIDGVAALAAGGWCTLNFWRCRHAHCLISGAGWLVLSLLAFVEAGLGRSLIGGGEQLAFLGVLVVAVVFEVAWYLAHGTNALVTGAPHRSMAVRMKRSDSAVASDDADARAV
jgi:hypothetical protein